MSTNGQDGRPPTSAPVATEHPLVNTVAQNDPIAPAGCACSAQPPNASENTQSPLEGEVMSAPSEAGEKKLLLAYQEHRGPLPHPDILAGYERACPGAAKQILKWTEEQGQHRREMERVQILAGVEGNKALIRVYSRNTFLGMVSSFLLGLTGIVGGIFLVYKGKSLAGFGTFFVCLGSLVGVYVWGRLQSHRESKDQGPEEEEPSTNSGEEE